MKKEFPGNRANGKGSKRRQENFQQVQERWDLIDWKSIKSNGKQKN